MIPCAECGKDTTHDRAHYQYTQRDQELCFSCEHWTALLEQDRTQCFVVDGEHYQLGGQTEKTPSLYRGFGGRRFVLQCLATGEHITTVDLWAQGTVPEHFRERMPNDVVFIQEQQDTALSV